MELESLIYEIRALRVKRAFGLSEDELVGLIRKDERIVHVLYELHMRYGHVMDRQFADAAIVYLLSSEHTSFEEADDAVMSSERRVATMNLRDFGLATPMMPLLS